MQEPFYEHISERRKGKTPNEPSNVICDLETCCLWGQQVSHHIDISNHA